MYSNDDSRKRGPKRRKKKGPVEPQRPVSAYALFFRDTQAAIKAENSSATFGEISKIVASMWDSLSEDAKQVYKQKTETAKREYLKQLAAYRANMVSKGGTDMEEEDSQPLSVLREKMAEQRASSTSPAYEADAGTSSSPIIDLTQGEDLPPPPKLQLAPGLKLSESCVKLRPLSPHQLPPLLDDALVLSEAPQTSRSVSPGPVLTKIIIPGQNGGQPTIHFINSGSTVAQGSAVSRQSPVVSLAPLVPPSKHIVLKPMPTVTPQAAVAPKSTAAIAPAPIQLRGIVSQSVSPLTILPRKPGQIIKVVESETGGIKLASVPTSSVKGRIIKMVDVVHPSSSYGSSLTLTTSTGSAFSPAGAQPDSACLQQWPVRSSQEQQVQPILQLLAQETSENDDRSGAQPSRTSAQPIGGGVHSSGTPDMSPQEPSSPQEDTSLDDSLLTDPGPYADVLMDDVDDSQHANAPRDPSPVLEPGPRLCVRDGCTNVAVSSPLWDNEYCCNECVYSHCRDVFDAWVSTRQMATSVM